MTYPEIIRMICYMIGAPSFLVLALDGFRHRNTLQGVKDLGFSMLFLWYMVEISLISTGMNTREYRVIGTPMIIAVTLASFVLAGRVLLEHYRALRRMPTKTIGGKK